MCVVKGLVWHHPGLLVEVDQLPSFSLLARVVVSPNCRALSSGIP